MSPFLALAGFTGAAASLAAAAEAVHIPLQDGPIVQSIGVGATVWVIRELIRLRRDNEQFRIESRHSRRVIAMKLGLSLAELEPQDTNG
jgi:hypothetical protein